MNRHRAGKPAKLQLPPIEHQSTEQPGDLAWLAWLLIAAMLTASAMCIGYIVGWWL